MITQTIFILIVCVFVVSPQSVKNARFRSHVIVSETGGVALPPTRDTEVDDAVTSVIQTQGHRCRHILTTVSARNGFLHKLRVTLDESLQK